jgi:hypothetical protein
MAIHAVTFRLEHDDTYSERYKSVVAAIRGATKSTYWDEPTSFALIESDSVSKDVAEFIDNNSTLDKRKDLLLVINLTQKGYTHLGVVKDEDLHTLMKRR